MWNRKRVWVIFLFIYLGVSTHVWTLCVCVSCSVVSNSLWPHGLLDYSLPSSSVHGILQARILEQVPQLTMLIYCWDQITQREFPLPPLATPSLKVWVGAKGGRVTRDVISPPQYSFAYYRNICLGLLTSLRSSWKRRNKHQSQGGRFKNVTIPSSKRHHLRRQSSAKIGRLFTIYRLI